MGAWLVLAAAVGVIDVHAVVTDRPTLSSAFRDGTQTHPLLVAAVTLYLVSHLYGKWPQRIDPLRNLGRAR